MLKRCICGFQIGADIAAAKAAKKAGLETGGWIPKYYITQRGYRPEYKEMYGAKEHESPKYPPRTELNVKESDATLRFASDFNSSGELCTLKFIKLYNKPYLDIDINNPLPASAVKNWILDNKIEVLNVAGNSEFTSKGIERFVEKYLLELFSLLKEENDDVPF